MKSRKLFDELLEGMDAIVDAGRGKRTLLTHSLEVKPTPQVSARELLRLRRGLKMSCGLFAGYLRTNIRTP